MLELAREDIPIPQSMRRALAGKLSAATPAIPSGRFHLAALYNEQNRSSALSDKVTNDLRWWLQRLGDRANGTRLVALGPASSSDAVIHSQSDAAGNVGCGLKAGNIVIHGTFQDTGDDRIPVKELTPVLLFLHRFGKWFRGLTYCPAVDSSVVFYAISKGFTRDEQLVPALQQMFMLAESFHCELLADWLPRELNEFADALSVCPALADALHTCRSRLQNAGLATL